MKRIIALMIICLIILTGCENFKGYDQLKKECLNQSPEESEYCECFAIHNNNLYGVDTGTVEVCFQYRVNEGNE